SSILTQTFGEIRLDTALISDASFQMILVFDQDSVRAQIPDVNISLHHVEVLSDTTDILFGDLQMDLTQTDINLNNNVRLSCNTMLFERNEDITLSNVRLTGASGQRFVTCQEIAFKNFRLFEFLAGRELSADSIAIGNSTIHVTRDLPGLFPSFTGTRSARNQRPIWIKALTLRNVDLNYETESQHLSLAALDANARDITDLSWRSMANQLRAVSVKNFQWHDERQNVRSELKSVRLTPDRALIAAGSATIDSLAIEVSDLHVAHPLPILLNGDMNWDFAKAGGLRIRGVIPPAGSNGFSVEQLSVGDMEADIHFGDLHLATRVKDLTGREVNPDAPRHLQGMFSDLTITSPGLQLDADSIDLNTGRLSRFYNVTITDNINRAAMSYAETTGTLWTGE